LEKRGRIPYLWTLQLAHETSGSNLAEQPHFEHAITQRGAFNRRGAAAM
jgi:hypothetical protein